MYDLYRLEIKLWIELNCNLLTLSVPDEAYSRTIRAYLMKLISERFERTWWSLFQNDSCLPDEAYYRTIRAYLMKLIPERFVCTWWSLFQNDSSVPDEAYSRTIREYLMKLIPERFERTWWSLFQNDSSALSLRCIAIWANTTTTISKMFCYYKCILR